MKNLTSILYLTPSVLFSLNVLYSQEFDGYTFYNEMNSNTTYLIDKDW